MKAYRNLKETEFCELVIEYALAYEEGLADYSSVTEKDILEYWEVTECTHYDEMLSGMNADELKEFAGAIARRVNKDREDYTNKVTEG